MLSKNEFGNIYIGYVLPEISHAGQGLQMDKARMLPNGQLKQYFKQNSLEKLPKLPAHKLVMVKTLKFFKHVNFQKLQHHFKKIRFLKEQPGLLNAIGYSLASEDETYLNLMVIYEQLDYNLYGMLLQHKIKLFRERVQFALELAGIIKGLHEQSLFHGNLNPCKIFFTSAQKIKVSDWEFSYKLLNNQVLDYSQDEPSYLLGYAAPEQLTYFSDQQNLKIQAKELQISRHTDIWSLGMVFNLALFGIDAKSAEYQQQKGLYQGQDIKILPSDCQCPYGPSEKAELSKVASLIEGMVRFRPESRYSIEQVQDILQEIVSSQSNPDKLI